MSDGNAMAVAGAASALGEHRPRVRVITDVGDLLIALEATHAPRSVAAFLDQIDRGAYDGAAFWRTVRPDNDRGSPRISVIQASAAGGHQSALVPHEPTSETGLRHEDGTISLARADGGDGSPATFFLCLGAQPALDAAGERVEDGRGFAAFGRVVEGMETARAIHARETLDSAPDPYLAGQILERPVQIHRIAREAEAPAALLSALAEDYWSFRVREFPTEASAAGVESAAARMDGAAAEDHARRAFCAGAMGRRAHAIDADTLSAQDGVTLALLRGQLESIVAGFDLDAHYRASLFPFGFGDVPAMLAQQTPLVTWADREAFAERFAALPAFLRDSMTLLREGVARDYRTPRILLPRLLAMLDAHISQSGLVATVSRALAPAIAGATQESIAEQRERILNIVRSEVLPAIREIRAAFAGVGDEALTDSISVVDQPNGREYYRYKVRQQTSRDLDPDAIHEMGLVEVARIRAELDAVLEKMDRVGDSEAVAAELDARIATDAEALLSYARATAKRIDGLLPRLFGRMPRISYGVEPMSAESSGGLPPALAQPGPADRSMAGIYWLTALPEKCPLHLVVPLTLHEAWPGHLMQFAIAHELEALPAFRRYGWTDYNGYIEGWALYCERLGHDLGLYDEPADHFGLLSFELWRAARLVVDTGIHWKGWSRDAAVDYLRANSFLPDATVQSEVDRYIGMPAQALSYKIGERTIEQLRREAEAELGAEFSLRDFHDMLLETGPVMLSVLEAHARRWIDQRKRS